MSWACISPWRAASPGLDIARTLRGLQLDPHASSLPLCLNAAPTNWYSRAGNERATSNSTLVAFRTYWVGTAVVSDGASRRFAFAGAAAICHILVRTLTLFVSAYLHVWAGMNGRRRTRILKRVRGGPLDSRSGTAGSVAFCPNLAALNHTTGKPTVLRRWFPCFETPFDFLQKCQLSPVSRKSC